MVLPEPGPPETMIFRRAKTQALQELEHGVSESVVLDKIIGGEKIARETADAKAWAVERKGRDDGVGAGTIGETGVHDGRSFVHAAAHSGNDAGDDGHEVSIIAEGRHRCVRGGRDARCTPRCNC